MILANRITLLNNPGNASLPHTNIGLSGDRLCPVLIHPFCILTMIQVSQADSGPRNIDIQQQWGRQRVGFHIGFNSHLTILRMNVTSPPIWYNNLHTQTNHSQ